MDAPLTPRRKLILERVFEGMHRLSYVHRETSIMARRPRNVVWVGFTPDQTELLDLLDHLGNNGWARNSQTDAVMPKILADCEAAMLAVERIKIAMASVGYGREALHELDRWESKRTTGRFGR